MPWGWRIALGVIAFLGVCQALTMTVGFDERWLPRALGVWIAGIGFLTFILLGFTLNLALAVVMPLVLWRGQGWRLWLAVLPAIPFWLTVYRFVPKPW
jgi:hypothetical protein